MEQVYHMCEIWQSIMFAAFPAMRRCVKITINKNRSALEKKYLVAGKSLKNPWFPVEFPVWTVCMWFHVKCPVWTVCMWFPVKCPVWTMCMISCEVSGMDSVCDFMLSVWYGQYVIWLTWWSTWRADVILDFMWSVRYGQCVCDFMWSVRYGQCVCDLVNMMIDMTGGLTASHLVAGFKCWMSSSDFNSPWEKKALTSFQPYTLDNEMFVIFLFRQ